MDYLINMKGMKMEEYNILQTTIQANLDVIFEEKIKSDLKD